MNKEDRAKLLRERMRAKGWKPLVGTTPRPRLWREGKITTVEKIADVLGVEVWQLFRPDSFPEQLRKRGKSGHRIER